MAIACGLNANKEVGASIEASSLAEHIKTVSVWRSGVVAIWMECAGFAAQLRCGITECSGWMS